MIQNHCHFIYHQSKLYGKIKQYLPAILSMDQLESTYDQFKANHENAVVNGIAISAVET